MSYDKMDSSAVYAMFEEIKGKLNKQPEQIVAPAQPASVTAFDPEDIEKVEWITQKLDEVSKKLDRPQRHTHTIDLMSNKVLILLAIVMTAFIVSLWIVKNQRQALAQFRDNDLKYRYIQMKGQAEPEDILMLRDVFDYNHNADSIRIIRQRVEKYEQLIREQAEIEAKAKLNEEDAQLLYQAIEKLKQ